jgi:hypothetical protein
MASGARAHLSRLKVRPDIGTALAAGATDEAGLDVGSPHLVSPVIGAESEAVATMVVGTIDQDATHALLAHVAEGDLLRPHAGIKAAPG